jgi:ABC-type polysaccharide/polyol phosphate transport system ATPase subunit
MSKFWDEKTTILVVSHDSDFLKQSCRQAIWLEKGRIRLNGKAGTFLWEDYEWLHQVDNN